MCKAERAIEASIFTRRSGRLGDNDVCIPGYRVSQTVINAVRPDKLIQSCDSGIGEETNLALRSDHCRSKIINIRAKRSDIAYC